MCEEVTHCDFSKNFITVPVELTKLAYYSLLIYKIQQAIDSMTRTNESAHRFSAAARSLKLREKLALHLLQLPSGDKSKEHNSTSTRSLKFPECYGRQGSCRGAVTPSASGEQGAVCIPTRQSKFAQCEGRSDNGVKERLCSWKLFVYSN